VSNRIKNIIYTFILLLAVFLVWNYRENKKNALLKYEMSGNTMGTTYSVIYFDESKKATQKSIDSLLIEFNNALSTYIPNSEISRFNRGDLLTFESPYLYPVLRTSKNIFKQSEGSFDPTVMTLVNLWGFGPDDSLQPDSALVDSILNFTGFHHITFTDKEITKDDARVQLDFSAIAKGYGVDVVGEYLDYLKIENYFIEIGGEVLCKGKNIAKNTLWSLGITHPNSEVFNVFPYAILALKDRGMATSGNYFNYHEIDGKRYGHTLNPKTGYPIIHNLLSATVVAPSCMEADGWATTCMVEGFEKSKKLIENNKQLEAYFIYTDNDGSIKEYATQGLKGLVHKIE